MTARATLLLLALMTLGPGRSAVAQGACPDLPADLLADLDGSIGGAIPPGAPGWSSEVATVAGCPYALVTVDPARPGDTDTLGLASQVARSLASAAATAPGRRYLVVVDGPEPFADSMQLDLIAKGIPSSSAIVRDIRQDGAALAVVIWPSDVRFGSRSYDGPLPAGPPSGGPVTYIPGDGLELTPIEVTLYGGAGYDKQNRSVYLGAELAYAPPVAPWLAVVAGVSLGYSALPVYVTRWEGTHLVGQVNLALRLGLPRDWPAAAQLDLGGFVQPGISAGIQPGIGLRLGVAPVELWLHVPIHLTPDKLGHAGAIGTLRLRLPVRKRPAGSITGATPRRTR